MTCKVSEVGIQNNAQKILKNFKYMWIRERKRGGNEVHSPGSIKGKWKCKLNI